MILGIIDIGSNTVRLSVFDTSTKEQIDSGVNYAGLIAYVNNGSICDEGMEILCNAILQMKNICEKNKCDKIVAFATASLRDISDKSSLIRRVFEKTGVQIAIISGEKEAEYDYMGLRMLYNTQTGAVFDLGGGSGQLITFKDGTVCNFISKRIGALRLYNDFVSDVFPSEKEEKNIREYVKKQLSDFSGEGYEYVFAMGGAASALKKIFYNMFGKKDDLFTLSEIKSVLDFPVELIEKIIPERLYTIKPAVIAIEEICNSLKTHKIKAVTCGVREGVLSELCGKEIIL